MAGCRTSCSKVTQTVAGSPHVVQEILECIQLQPANGGVTNSVSATPASFQDALALYFAFMVQSHVYPGTTLRHEIEMP